MRFSAARPWVAHVPRRWWKTMVRCGLPSSRAPTTVGTSRGLEAGMLALAAECGVNAAQGRLRSVGDKDMLLVRRFDRERAERGWHRARMISALTLLRADDSVTARGQWAYPLLADEIRRASAAPCSDLRELFTRMCFNAAVSNLDDHPRNHAMIAGAGLAAHPGLRSGAVAGTGARTARAGDDLRQVRPLRQPRQPRQRERPLPPLRRGRPSDLRPSVADGAHTLAARVSANRRERDGLRLRGRCLRVGCATFGGT